MPARLSNSRPRNGRDAIARGHPPLNSGLPNRVLIADDHLMFRQGLRTLLEDEGFTIVAEAENGQEAIRKARQHGPQVVVLDYSMPVLNGIEAAKEILKQSPRPLLVLLTMHDNESYALEALKCGIRGYVLKHQAADELVSAIREVLRGSIYLSPGISAAVVKALMLRQEGRSEVLTGREKQVLQLIAEGHTNKGTAHLLHLSVKTVESHRSRIMRKLDIHNTASLVRYTVRQGMIQA